MLPDIHFMKPFISLLLPALFSLIAGQSVSQNFDPSKVNKKAINFYNLGLDRAQNGAYKEALNLLDQAIQIEPKYVDAWLTKAGISGELKDYANAVTFYEKAFAIDSQSTKDYKLPYAIDLAGSGSFDKALNAVNSFLTNPDLNDRSRKAGEYRKASFEFAAEYDKTHPTKNYVFAPRNLGDSINTSELEYYPSLTIDGSTLIFTRRVHGYNEDFFVSHHSDSGWTKSMGIDGDINTNFNEGAQNISQDGEWLVFTGCNFPEGLGGCDIYLFNTHKKRLEQTRKFGSCNQYRFLGVFSLFITRQTRIVFFQQSSGWVRREGYLCITSLTQWPVERTRKYGTLYKYSG